MKKKRDYKIIRFYNKQKVYNVNNFDTSPLNIIHEVFPV